MSVLVEKIAAAVFAERMRRRVVAKSNGDDSWSVVVYGSDGTGLLVGTIWCQSRGVWAYAIEGVQSSGGWANTKSTKREAVEAVREAFARGKCPVPKTYRKGKTVMRTMSMFVDDQEIPRAWGISVYAEQADNEAKRQLDKYIEKKRALGEILSVDDFLLKRVEVK